MKNNILLPIAIVIAGVIIALAVIFSNPGSSDQANSSSHNRAEENQSSRGLNSFQEEYEPEILPPKRVSKDDHIIGSLDAEIFIVEYSDLECPFCKRYHDTALTLLKEDYQNDERVAFVFRHFPLAVPYISRELHASADEQAVAAECIAKYGGEEKFFEFVDHTFATTSSDGRYDLSKLPDIAEDLGVDREKFTTCYQNEETRPIIDEAFAEGAGAGVNGTPTVFAQTADGESIKAIADYNILKNAIDQFLES